MAGKDRVGEIIKAGVAVVTFIAVTVGFGVIKTAFAHLLGFTRRAFTARWPAQFADGMIALSVIDEILEVDLPNLAMNPLTSARS